MPKSLVVIILVQCITDNNISTSVTMTKIIIIFLFCYYQEHSSANSVIIITNTYTIDHNCHLLVIVTSMHGGSHREATKPLSTPNRMSVFRLRS